MDWKAILISIAITVIAVVVALTLYELFIEDQILAYKIKQQAAGGGT
jgi:hypothetical protein